MSEIEINGSDDATTHVFHIDLPREAIERFVTQAGTGEWPFKYALGARELRAGFVDIVDLRDLGAMTLSSYLAQAHNVSQSAVQAHKARLDGLSGHVAVLPPPAFGKVSQSLSVAVPLRHVAKLEENRAARRGADLRSASAAGQARSQGGGDGGALQRPAVIAALVLAALGLVFLLIVVF